MLIPHLSQSQNHLSKYTAYKALKNITCLRQVDTVFATPCPIVCRQGMALKNGSVVLTLKVMPMCRHHTLRPISVLRHQSLDRALNNGAFEPKLYWE